MHSSLTEAVDAHLRALVERHPDRHVGGPGNVHATAYVEDQLRRQGWQVSESTFDAVDAEVGPALLEHDSQRISLHAGPYTLPADIEAPLLAIDSLAALEARPVDEIRGRIILLHGDIARDQLLPRGFDFLDAPEHRRIYACLEGASVAAVIGATGRGGGMGGGLYPYPLIEDGDFDLPNAYTTDETGVALLALAGRTVRLTIHSRRYAVRGRQLTARVTGPKGRRVVVMAHLDSKEGSPGAVDNATGTAALLAIGELLAGQHLPVAVELVPMNGEDHYSAGGEHRFVADNTGRWDEIVLAANLDAVGARGAGTAVSLYGCPPWLEQHIDQVVARHPMVEPGEAWYESDHSIVAMHGRPAMALTSTTFRDLCAGITHTPRDTLAIVDAEPVAAAAEFVADVIRSLPPNTQGPTT
jgi:aminopeptidase YwaD